MDDVINEYLSYSKCYMTGTIKLDSDEKFLFYKDNDDSHSFNIEEIKDIDLDNLIQCAKISHFGLYKKNVVDLTVRKSKEIQSSNFAVQFNIENKVNLLELLKNSYKIKPYKLNIYQKGDFFDFHEDTYSKDLLATLVLCFPVKHEGGELLLNFNNILFAHKFKRDEFSWICFFPDCTHKVKEVISGTRITLTYKVLKGDACMQKLPQEIKGLELTDELLNNFEAKFLEHFKAGKVLYLIHSYTSIDIEEENFKNIDNFIIKIIKKNNVEYAICRAFEEEDNDVIYLDPDDEVSSYLSDNEFECSLDLSEISNLIKIKKSNMLNPSSSKQKLLKEEYTYYHGYNGNAPIEDETFLYYKYCVRFL